MRNKGQPRWKLLIALLCCFLLTLGPLGSAFAEDVFVLDVDVLNMNLLNNNDYVAQHLSAQTQGVRVKKSISNSSELAESVRLTLVQMDTQTLLFDKDYGYQSKLFDSGVIYLPYVDNRTIPYLITLYVGDTIFAIPFMQLQPRLTYNSACTYGLRLRDLENGLSSDWLMGTMLDLNSLRASGALSLDLCASNAYLIGQAGVEMQGEALSVRLNFIPEANVEIHSLSMYVVTDCSLLTGDPIHLGLPASAPGEWVDVSGANSAFLYLPMQISYDPAGLSAFGYDLSNGYLQGQLALWQQNRYATPEAEHTAELVPLPSPEESLGGELSGPTEAPEWPQDTQPPMETPLPGELPYEEAPTESLLLETQSVALP